MAIIIGNSNPARMQGIARPHYKFAMNFLVDANGGYIPQRNTRILFENGVDDITGTFANAGYSNLVGQSDNIEITTARKGGAISQNTASLILAISFMPEATPRVGLTAAGGADANFTASLAPRRGGLFGDVEAGLTGRLFAAAMKGAQMSLLPAGNNTGCSIFLGIPQLQAPGTGFHNSEIPSMGFPAASTRFALGDDVIVFPTREQQEFRPNRIQLDWPSANGSTGAAGGVASTNDDVIELPGGAPARAAGLFVALDMIAIIDFASIVLKGKSGEILDPGTVADGSIASWDAASDQDDAKIKAFRRCF